MVVPGGGGCKRTAGHVHKKGTFSLAYSMDYHCLLTAGLDQEARVQPFQALPALKACPGDRHKYQERKNP
eukprot:141602-Amphidinium_carterae.1